MSTTATRIPVPFTSEQAFAVAEALVAYREQAIADRLQADVAKDTVAWDLANARIAAARGALDVLTDNIVAETDRLIARMDARS